MERNRTSPGQRILRRIKRRSLHLTRLLLVIRTFRRTSRAPLYRTVACQIQVDLEGRRSPRAILAGHRRDLWQLRRSLSIVSPSSIENTVSDVVFAKRDTRPLWVRQGADFCDRLFREGFSFACSALLRDHRAARAPGLPPPPPQIRRVEASLWARQLAVLHSRLHRRPDGPLAHPMPWERRITDCDTPLRVIGAIFVASVAVIAVAATIVNLPR